MLQLKTYSEEQIIELLANQPDGRYTKFFRQAHSLWTRFKNYSKNPPYVLEDVVKVPVAIIYSTFSERTKYTNLYEILVLKVVPVMVMAVQYGIYGNKRCIEKVLKG